MLAVNEQQHEKRFSELKNKIKNEEIEGWGDVSQYLRAIVESEFFLGKNKSLPSLEHAKTVTDAVNFALGFEKEKDEDGLEVIDVSEVKKTEGHFYTEKEEFQAKVVKIIMNLLLIGKQENIILNYLF